MEGAAGSAVFSCLWDFGKEYESNRDIHAVYVHGNLLRIKCDLTLRVHYRIRAGNDASIMYVVQSVPCSTLLHG